MAPFVRSLIKEILIRMHQYCANNWDYLRFGPNPTGDLPNQIVFDPDKATHFFIDLIEHGVDYQWLHDALEDDASRRLLIDLLTYRVLDCSHVKLPLNTERFWQEYKTIDSRFLQQAKVGRSHIFDLNRYGFTIEGKDVQIVGHPLSILALILGQYFYDKDGVKIGPEPGDVVIDGGGCWGETAIAFAIRVGERGKVFSFEFLPANLQIFRTNLSFCKPYSDVVTVVELALGRKSKEKLFYSEKGPGSVLTDKFRPNTVETLSIDDFVGQNQLEKVDFIKLDVEGSELAALEGAANTIRTFRPKLAISVYHQIDDIFMIPSLIRWLESTYRFYLEHYSIHLEETILYAKAR